MPPLFIARWDIFCTVIDNYGDIGVCWRLARQLANEQQQIVRLFVDDLRSFERICPAIDPQLHRQCHQQVEVCLWQQPFGHIAANDVADIVIEAFACDIPAHYIEAMSLRPKAPVWFNLEYLSAEQWVVGCHAMRSPHPRYPLQKTFFFPGFVAGTGGVLCEQDLLQRRDAFLADAQAQRLFWQGIHIPPPAPDESRILLFGYESPVGSLIDSWVQSPTPVSVCVPEGVLAQQCVTAMQGRLQQGSLQLYVLPFIEQSRFDELLWACDINFVRGEDSFVRAQWAGKPFVWQIYRQEENAHLVKLEAFLQVYGEGLGPQSLKALVNFWYAWNSGNNLAACWADFLQHAAEMQQHNHGWLKNIQKVGDLTTNMMLYCQKYL